MLASLWGIESGDCERAPLGGYLEGWWHLDQSSGRTVMTSSEVVEILEM